MKSFFQLMLLSSLILCPLCLSGCSSQLSEEETPMMATDEDAPAADAATTNDPENP
ncbi:hypothetical protein FF011L_54730 [Roseimaritima multifibrata]|uniref:Lipoprotein n=1 Tax=Roseimaritima multifibrata TaxID=1930274 RepID=A0A517MP46_9BACT|nr:hypothetical protein [Roseimaritima multifibrata]QDS96661.1 hypothetical protein FF011L_54730 [Roseimaritima multifibrata]